MQRKSNEIWKNWSNYNNWELRRHRFPEEMRPLYLQYLGIKPDSYVLDGGCGTGVLTRYLAGGLKNGRITGFDINEGSVDYGNKKIAEENLAGIAELVAADGFELPFEDNTFDAVTNYTYLGVLSDPAAGLKEMIRVCRAGGTVSAVIATNKIPGVTWKGDYPFGYNDRLDELYRRQEEIYQKHILNPATMYYQSEEWHSFRYPKLFGDSGLNDIHIYTAATCFSYNDARWPIEYRRRLIDTGMNDQIRWIRERSRISEFENYGFTREDFEELVELLGRKRRYLLDNIETDRSFEWCAGLHIIVSGVK